MAKKTKTMAATVVSATKRSEVATSTEFDDMLLAAAGQGISNRAADNIVSSLSILQPMSPEVMEDRAESIEGAKAGDFLVGETLVKGKDGIWFQPCHVEHRLFEFVPLERGGGFVAEHAVKVDQRGIPIENEYGDVVPPQGATRVAPFRYEFANGNSLVHYRHWAGILWQEKVGQHFIIPFKGTGHTEARKWMTKAGLANQLPDGRQMPLFAHVYKLTTVSRRNSKGQWYSLEVGDPMLIHPDKNPSVADVVGDPTSAFKRGMALNDSFSKGEVTGAAPVAAQREVTNSEEIPF